jgi:hypothetical protein
MTPSSAARSAFAAYPLPGSLPIAGAGQTVVGDRWRITVVSDGILRVEWSDDGGFEDRASTLAVRRAFAVPEFRVDTGSDGGVVVRTARITLSYDGAPFSARGLSARLGDGRSDVWHYGDAADDLGGTARTLDDVDGRTPVGPGVVSRRGVAVLDDTESFLFDDAGWMAVRRAGRRDLYLFAYGDDYPAAVSAFYDLSGHPPVLPRWALGNWWSRFFPYTADDYLALIDRFRDEGLPFSVAVLDMDWHRVEGVPEGQGTGWTGYSWNRALYPDPPAFLRALHDRGLRTTLNLHPADGVRAHEDAYASMARRVGIDPEQGQAVRFDPTDRAFLAAYFDELHHPLEAEGVDFWWIDWQQGEHSVVPGVDPLWLLNHFHHLDATRDGARGLVFSRYAGPGSHRYPVGFSGDSVISWASLAFQPEFTATAANIGYGWWSHDIGGHLDGVRDDELATRWVQLGVFSPILRLHSTRNPFIRKEPWAYPADHREAMGAALRLRHRLVPYLHTMNYRAASGTPLVRPMYHAFPSSEEAHSVPNQYVFGSELLVAPIVTPSDTVTRAGRVGAWLPPGGWTDIATGVRYAGDRHVVLHRPLESIPALLRDGGILPLDSTDALDATRNPSAIEVLVAPADSGAFVLVEDAAESADSAVCTTPLAWRRDALEFVVGAAAGAVDAVPASRAWTATFFGRWDPVEPVVVHSGDIRTPVLPVVAENSWSVSFTAESAVGATVVLPHLPDATSDPLPEIRRLLERSHTSNTDKVRAWAVISDHPAAAERLARLAALGLEDSLHAAVVELLGTPS